MAAEDALDAELATVKDSLPALRARKDIAYHAYQDANRDYDAAVSRGKALIIARRSLTGLRPYQDHEVEDELKRNQPK